MKKAYLFSLFVVMALVLVATLYKTKIEFKNEERADVFKKRVTAANTFIDDMEKDLERSLYVSSFRALIGVDEYIHLKGTYAQNLSIFLPELIIQGTYNGTKLNSTNSSTITDWMVNINKLAKRVNLNINFTNISVDIESQSPFTVSFTIYSLVNITDFENSLGWNYPINQTTMIDIAEASFSDPTYFMESRNNTQRLTPLFNNIKKSPYGATELWTNDSGYINLTKLEDAIVNQYYFNSSTSPSFLMRMQGKFDCDADPDSEFANYHLECQKNGIESFVNVFNNSEVFKYSWTDGDFLTCAVDYQFFKEEQACEENDQYRIFNMTNQIFVLDSDKIKQYNLSKIAELTVEE